ncbi:unnamed protein product [Mytilus coruscus]|uniref:Tyr recombinase domain-containing protein n=1 Tax=Mytilus coruscus TaxID=42192 RepID=A0A6J8AMF8_MYTCO|nr:unnamed protein product [Mytilus coruscus]
MPPKRKPSERQSKRQKKDQTQTPENAMTEAISAAVTAKVLENLKENGILPQPRQTRPQPVEMDVLVHEGRTVFENSPSCSTQTVLSSTSIPATKRLEYVTILANAALAPSTQATYSRAWKTFDSFCTEIMNQSPHPPLSGKAAEVPVCFRKFKHNVKGMPKTISFSHGTAMESAVVAMVEYLKVRPYSVPTEPLFCSVDATPLHPPDFDRILHKCLASCGLDSSRYKGHSFRIGAATDAAERGLFDSQIRSMGRWKSNAFQKYIRSHLN